LKPTQLAEIEPEAFGELNGKQLSQLGPKQATGVTTEQLKELDETQEKALKKSFIAKLSAEEKAALAD